MSSDAQETFILRDVFINMTFVQTFFHGKPLSIEFLGALNGVFSRDIFCGLFSCAIWNEYVSFHCLRHASIISSVVKRKTPRLLFAAVVAMFSMSTIQLALNWQRIRRAFISNGDTALDTVNTLGHTPMAIVIVGSSMLVLNNFVADCVLVILPYIDGTRSMG
jgi:hypothetical protein